MQDPALSDVYSDDIIPLIPGTTNVHSCMLKENYVEP